MNTSNTNTYTEQEAKLYKSEQRDDRFLFGVAKNFSELKDIINDLNIETLFDLLLYENETCTSEARYRKKHLYIEIIYERNDCINYLLQAGLSARTSTQQDE